MRPEFFQRPVEAVAPALIGCRLCRRWPDGRVSRAEVREVEAYAGPEDLASHARFGRTARNRIMFAAGGNWYVYLCYGIHWMLNVTAGPEGEPAAILLRGAGEWSGPGRLTRALEVDKRFGDLPCNPHTGLWFETPGETPPEPARVRQTPRIGVDYAGPVWSAQPWRWLLA